MSTTPAAPTPRPGRFEVFRDRVGAWRFRLLGGNGEIVANSEAYTREWDAHRAARTVRDLAQSAQLPPTTGQESLTATPRPSAVALEVAEAYGPEVGQAAALGLIADQIADLTAALVDVLHTILGPAPTDDRADTASLDLPEAIHGYRDAVTTIARIAGHDPTTALAEFDRSIDTITPIYRRALERASHLRSLDALSEAVTELRSRGLWPATADDRDDAR